MSEPNIFGFSSEALPATTRVLTFHGSEAISRLYAFEVYLLLPRDDSDALDLATVIGQRATLQVLHSDGSPRRSYHGVVTALELVHELPGDAVYRAVLSPKFWTLQLTRHSNVFVDQSIPDIIEGVLQDSGLSSGDYEFRLATSYPQHLHVCQYRESNFDFVCRWMEREGMYWYFEHTGEKEKLIITDASSRQEPMGDGPVAFVAGQGQNNSAIEALHGFTVRHAMLPTAVGLRDYDYLRPRVEVFGTAPIASNGVGEINSFGDNVPSVGESRRIARVRAQEYLTRQVVYHGTGRVFDLQPGYFFELDTHPRAAFNQRYLTIEQYHRGNNASADEATLALVGGDTAEVYRVDIVAIPASTQFRAESTTRTPRIYGVEFAVVDGAIDSDYAQIDEHGRYHVKIMFDERDARNGRASTRVRMLQPHGGNPEGFHFPLRKGTEVTLSFLGGDPDRPVISAVAPNAERPSTVTESNHTQNVIHTGSDNRIEMEDLAGSQYIDVMSPPQTSQLHLGAHNARHAHNWVITTDGNGLVHTGGDRNITVGGDQTEDVEGNLVEDYHGNQTTHVYGKFKETIDGHSTITILSGEDREVIGDFNETTQGNETHDVAGDITETVGGSVQQTISGNLSQTVSGNVTTSTAGGHTHTITGAFVQTVQGGYTLTSPAGVKIIATAGWQLIAPGGTTTVDSFFDKTGGKSIDAFGFKMSITGSKIDIVPGLAFGYTSVKVDVTGTKADITGAKFANSGVGKIETMGQFMMHAYCSLHLCGFMSIL